MFVGYISGCKITEVTVEMVFQRDLHGSTFSKENKTFLLKDILCLKRRSCLRPHPLARNRTKQIRSISISCNAASISISIVLKFFFAIVWSYGTKTKAINHFKHAYVLMFLPCFISVCRGRAPVGQ